MSKLPLVLASFSAGLLATSAHAAPPPSQPTPVEPTEAAAKALDHVAVKTKPKPFQHPEGRAWIADPFVQDKGPSWVEAKPGKDKLDPGIKPGAVQKTPG